MATKYASPAGGGTGASPASPYQISNFWASASAGDQLFLADGTYTGANSMITPTAGLSGLSGSQIKISATNDGAVTIDGEGARTPISLNNNDYFVVEGVNCKNSSTQVCGMIGGTSNSIFRRICAWDAPIGYNNHVFEITGGGTNNLVEDCAGFGTGRKVFSCSQAGTMYTTFRRCWGRWQGSTNVGPKDTFVALYNTDQTNLENCLGTWTAESMPASYTLQNGGSDYITPGTSASLAIGLGNKTITVGTGLSVQFTLTSRARATNGTNWMEGPVSSYSGSDVTINVDTTNGSGSFTTWDVINKYTSSEVEAPTAVFEAGVGEAGGGSMYGNLAYITSSAFSAPRIFIATREQNFVFWDCVGYFGAGLGSGQRVFQLLDLNGTTNGTGTGCAATNITAFHASGLANQIATIYGTTNQIDSASQPSAYYTGGMQMYTADSSHGAAIRYRYQNKILTATALWPWPMNDRIKAATAAAGYTVEDINATIQSIFGNFPPADSPRGGVWFVP